MARGDGLHGSRSFGSFLRAVRAQSGFKWRLLSASAFWAALAVKEGVRWSAELLGLSIVAALLLGYPLWRRWGQ